FDPEAWRLVAATDKLAVDLPLPVASLKPEGASDSLRIGCVREPVEVSTRRNSCWIHAVIGHYRTVDDDLQYLGSLTSAQNVSRRTTPVVLLQTILEIERLTGVVGEIDDYINALSH